MDSKDTAEWAAAEAPPPELVAAGEPYDDSWFGCESTHPLTWIPGSSDARPAASEP